MPAKGVVTADVEASKCIGTVEVSRATGPAIVTTTDLPGQAVTGVDFASLADNAPLAARARITDPRASMQRLALCVGCARTAEMILSTDWLVLVPATGTSVALARHAVIISADPSRCTGRGVPGCAGGIGYRRSRTCVAESVDAKGPRLPIRCAVSFIAARTWNAETVDADPSDTA